MSPLRFRARKTLRFGPLFARFTERGFSSWGVRVWRWTWNATRGSHSFDTTGPGAVSTGPRRRRPRGEDA